MSEDATKFYLDKLERVQASLRKQIARGDFLYAERTTLEKENAQLRVQLTSLQVLSKGQKAADKIRAYEKENKRLRELLNTVSLSRIKEHIPAAWISKNVFPFRPGKDNHPCILTPFKCAGNTVPLYSVAPDPALIIAKLEAKIAVLEEKISVLEETPKDAE